MAAVVAAVATPAKKLGPTKVEQQIAPKHPIWTDGEDVIIVRKG